MTQAISSPENSSTKPATYFTNRQKTGLSRDFVRVFNIEATQYNIDYTVSDHFFVNLIPFMKYYGFVESSRAQNLALTYDFVTMNSEDYFSKELDKSKGFVTFSIA